MSGDVIPVFRPTIPTTALDRISECLESGWLGYGPKCKELEARFELRGGHALVTANCTAALHIAAHLSKKTGRQRVLVPAITFVSTAMAFSYAGLDVELVDVDPRSGLIDLQDVKRRITSDCCAIVAVHLYGQRANVSELRDLCDAHDLVLIEDCAHRLDLLDNAIPIGDIACYSFNAIKEVPGGEGGMLWCADSMLIERAQQISNLGLTIDTHSRASTTVHRDYAFGGELGLKLRGFDLSAALVLSGLANHDFTRQVRSQIFSKYDSAVENGNMFFPLARKADDSFLMYVARTKADMRSTVRQNLADKGIATSIHYPSLSRNSALTVASLPGAETFDSQIVTLPCFPSMTEEQVNRVVDAVTSLDQRTV